MVRRPWGTGHASFRISQPTTRPGFAICISSPRVFNTSLSEGTYRSSKMSRNFKGIKRTLKIERWKK